MALKILFKLLLRKDSNNEDDASCDGNSIINRPKDLTNFKILHFAIDEPSCHFHLTFLATELIRLRITLYFHLIHKIISKFGANLVRSELIWENLQCFSVVVNQNRNIWQ